MIKVTGLFTTSDNRRYFKSPELHLIPHLQFARRTSLDVHIVIEEQHIGAFGYEDVPIELFDGTSGNAYSAIISKLEQFVIDDMQPINPECIFEIVSPEKPNLAE